MTVFDKLPLSISEHINQWNKRGLSITDRERAERYLSVISYYRLSAYSLPFQTGNPDHHFKQGISFEDVLELYIFDRRLRLLILDAIERIEVALRARMTNVLAENHGPHAYLNKDIFDTRYNHDWLISQVRRKCNDNRAETFIKHYRTRYRDPDLPPVWMILEILTFKEVSVLFSYLRTKEDKQAIAGFWGLNDTVLRSWFRALSDLRNVCAHHSRTWNREFGSRPMVPKKPPAIWPDLNRPLADPKIKTTRRLYYLLVVIETLLRNINPGSTWHERLWDLLEKYPNTKVSRKFIMP
ncbi:MAG TPA: Abi family protein, partial [Desulfarculaceae bacterium]|nr:Abi family protein [Desulfarculaceae bacterium]